MENIKFSKWNCISLFLIFFLAGCHEVAVSPNPISRPTAIPTFTPEPSLYESWKGIEPGNTTLEQVKVLLGQPDQIREDTSFLVYRYDSRPNWGWEIIELWLEQADDQWTVSAILFTIPYLERGISLVPSQITPLLLEYNQPTKVTWSNIASARYWVWPQLGIGVSASSQLIGLMGDGWKNTEYSELLIFKSMTLEQFLEADWPWPLPSTGFAQENQFTGKHGNVIDTLPEDPYDWTTMPTPMP